MGKIGELLGGAAAALWALAALWAVRGSITRERGPRGELVAYFGVGAVAAFLTAAMDLLELFGGGSVAGAVGNAANVLCPGLVWAGSRRLNSRTRVGVLPVVATSLVILALTFVVTAEAAIVVKTAAIAVFCALGAVEVRRRRMRMLPGSRVIAIALAAFGVYNAARLVIAAVAGIGSATWNSFASAGITAVAAAAAVVAVSVGSLLLGRRLLDDPEPGTRTHAQRRFEADARALLAEYPEVVALRVQIADMPLIRAAHGSRHAEAMLSTAERAARAALPGAATGPVSRDTIGVLLPGMAEGDETEDDLRARFRAASDDAGVDAESLHITRARVDAAGVAAFFVAAD